jgi:uncharacterized protein (DUF58 family)
MVVEGFITGLHQSPYHGFSVEFSEYRQYMPGDALRDLDWKVFGKTDRLYVKQYEEETNLKAHLLIDASASMAYGSDAISKFQYASYTAAALSHLMLRQRDAVGLIAFDDRIRTYLPPRSVTSHLHTLLTTLQNTSPEGTDTDLAATFHELAERIVRRGLVIVISDLFDDHAGDQVQAREPGDDFGFEIFLGHPYKPAARKSHPATAPPTTSHTAPTPRHNIRMDAMPAIAILGIESRVR